MSDREEPEIWPVEPSAVAGEVLADPRLPADLFGKIVALTVAIAEDPWLHGNSPAPQGKHWRTVPIPDGGGIVEYWINEEAHTVVLTRVFPF
ncbi:hypothetical protein ACSNOK_31860 [Streptomyces sp. URMC 126]|uniref:hypothetical protein n=1 Tax=Streptomyces sp. URMC 126 TaxID=3423401 RepID=UPI003F1B2F7E